MSGSTEKKHLDSSHGRLENLRGRVFQFLLFAILIYFFMFSIKLMGASIGSLKDNSQFLAFFSDTIGNPFVALFMGILSTAIIQSSSTTTSIIVLLVAGTGNIGDPETISSVVPLILGANIGTAVTSTIVALGHIASKDEYRRAMATAALHDFFNIFTVVIVLPLEMLFGILSKPASALAGIIETSDRDALFNIMDAGVRPLVDGVQHIFSGVISPAFLPALNILLGIIFLFLTLKGIISQVRKLFSGIHQNRLERALFSSPLKSLAWGFGITGILQSSSVTTSLAVPFVATGKVSIRNVFPFIMGANIGTTITALLTAILASGINPRAGLAVALIHVLFNAYGILIFFPVKQLRELPVKLARKLGAATYSNRLVGILYIVIIFFLLPFLLILADKLI